MRTAAPPGSATLERARELPGDAVQEVADRLHPAHPRTATGRPDVVVLPLAEVVVPPVARLGVGNGTDEPPVFAPLLSTHPVGWMLPATVPVTVEQVVLPFGGFGFAAPGGVTTSAKLEIARAAAPAPVSIRRRRKLPGSETLRSISSPLVLPRD